MRSGDIVNMIVTSPAQPPSSLPSAVVTSISSDGEGVQCLVRDITVIASQIKNLNSPSLPRLL